MTQRNAPIGDPATAAPRPARILSIGETLIDLIVADGSPSLETASDLVARMGGAPANVAVASARLGADAAFCGVVGDDPFGRRLRHGLAEQGVDTSALAMSAGAPTTMAFAWKDQRGDGHFWLLRGADVLLSDRHVSEADVPSRDAIVVGSVALAAMPSRAAIEDAARRAVATGVVVCFDVNLRPTLWPDLAEARTACTAVLRHTTLIKLSVDDASGILGLTDPDQIVATLLRDTPAKVVVLTDGSRGAWFASRGAPSLRHVPAFPVDAVEPTGAGDAFTAALLTRLHERNWADPTESDVAFASGAGALATTKRGAWEGLPTRAELDAFLAGR